MARYSKTEKGKHVNRLRQARLRRTEKHQTRVAAYRQGEKYRDTKLRCNHRRRARKHGANVLESIDRAEILRIDDLCHLCDVPVDPQAFHLDHVIPLAVEPIEAPWNAAVAHPTCNLRKHARLVPLSPAARLRWQERRPEHLALLDQHLARLAA
jgi:5-methylcytosine-specific restriction endonuclease McrA